MEGLIPDNSENKLEIVVRPDSFSITEKITSKCTGPVKSISDNKKKLKYTDREEGEIVEKEEHVSKIKTKTSAKRHKVEFKRKTMKKKVSEEDIMHDFDEDKEEGKVSYQGPSSKPAKDFTYGAFVILKTDLEKDEPSIYKIDKDVLLQKYVPFKEDGKILHKNTYIYTIWTPSVQDFYYSAPVTFLRHTHKEHVVQFHRDKINMNLTAIKSTKSSKQKSVEG